jgi:hypothetical protein
MGQASWSCAERSEPYRRGAPGSTRLLAAWRGLERFEGRASVRAWLYQIATNRALDALRATRRHPEDLQRMTEMPQAHPLRRGDLAGALPRLPAGGDPGPGSRAGSTL